MDSNNKITNTNKIKIIALTEDLCYNKLSFLLKMLHSNI